MNRRTFSLITIYTAAAALLTALLAALKSIYPNASAASSQVNMGYAQDYPLYVFTLIKDRNIFIIRDHQGIRAVSALCTHLGCVLQSTETGFSCPCHGSVFSESGKVISGPAPTDLAWYAIDRLPNGQLSVNTKSIIPAENKFLI